ncbi:hypothetical protein D3C75_1330190 [compost metagenome]
MGQDVETLLLDCIEGDLRDVGGAELTGLGGLAGLLLVLFFQRIGGRQFRRAVAAGIGDARRDEGRAQH